jgi:hypothetical protein
MAVEDADEERRWKMIIQTRAQKQKAKDKKLCNTRVLRSSARLTKIISKIEVGRGQREIEVLKSRTAEKVQCLRTAGSGKWAAEGDKVSYGLD